MKKKNILLIGGLILSFSILQFSYVDMKKQTSKVIITNSETVGVVINQKTFFEIIEKVEAKENINQEDEEPSSEVIKEKYLYENLSVCSSSNVKTYMNYQAITNTSSKQYKFIKNYMYVDETNGLLRYNNDNEFIGVALGSSFGEIGSMYRFTLDTGVVLNLIKVEAKSDKHTNNGCEQMYDKSVIEFVIDSNYAKPVFGGGNGYVANGNFNNIEDFKGKIIKIERVFINE